MTPPDPGPEPGPETASEPGAEPAREAVSGRAPDPAREAVSERASGKASEPAPGPAKVRRRHVFYIPGHDPAGAKRYRQIYLDQSARQARISGYEIRTEDLPPNGPYARWHARFAEGDTTAEATVEVLTWNDISKAWIKTPTPRSYLLLARTFGTMLGGGVLRAYARTRPQFMIALLYAYLAPLLAPLLAGLLALGLGAAFGLGGAALAALTLVAALGAIAWLRGRDRRLFAFYLLHAFALILIRRGAIPDELAPRQTAFAERIAEALRSDADEVLVVGHSAGGHMALQVVAEVLRMGHGRDGRLALLTMGAVIPMVSFLPQAQRTRADLDLLARTEQVFWLDISAPSDGACFALADPVAVTGIEVEPQHNPLILSAAFHQTVAPETRESRDFTFFRKHFQYLYAFENPKDYDYFRITAGPLRLADRYRGRASSPQTNRTPRSPHRDF